MTHIALSLLALLSEPARAEHRTLGVVIGAFTEWNAECLRETPSQPDLCRNRGRRLRHADEDAWRFAFLLRGRLPSEDILVFTEPDEQLLAEDSGTRLMGMDVELAGTPTMADIVHGVALRADAIRAEAGEDVQISIVLYISSHGSRDGFHLEDWLYDFDDLVELVRIAASPAGDARVEAVLSDACDSAAMSAKGSVVSTSATRVERAETLDISVYDKTDEVAVLRGGVLSYVLRSALVGGADYDQSGTLTAREVLDYLESYRGAFGSFYTPVVRARGSWDTVSLLEGPYNSSLVLGLNDPGLPKRWIISVGGDGQEPVVIADVFTSATPDSGQKLRLPSGTYEILELPYLPPSVDGGGFRADFTYDDNGERSFLGVRCALNLEAGSYATFDDCEEQELVDVLVSVHPSLVEQELPRRPRGPMDEVLGTFPNALPMARPAPDYRLRALNTRLVDQGDTWTVSSLYAQNILPRRGLLLGGALGYVLVPRKGDLMLRAGTNLSSEVGGSKKSLVVVPMASLGLGRPLLAGSTFQASGFVDVTGGVWLERTYYAPTVNYTRYSMLIGVDFGLALQLAPQSWSVRGVSLVLMPTWSPRLARSVLPNVYSDQPPEEVYFRPLVTRASVQLGLSVSPNRRNVEASR